MKELKYFIFGILVAFSVGLYSCQNDDVADPSATDDNEQTFTVLEDVTTKGSTDILEGCNTYKTGEYVKVKAKSGATISGTRLRGSGTISSTYEKNGYAWANIDDIHGDWKVSATLPDYSVTVKAGTGGTASGGGTVEKGSSVNISAQPSSGYTFDKWTLSTGSGSFANSTSSSTTFFPKSNCTVTANFKKKDDGYYIVSYSVGTIWTAGGLEFTIYATRSDPSMDEGLPSTLYMTYSITAEYNTFDGQHHQELYASGNAYIREGGYYCNVTHDKDIPNLYGDVEYTIQLSGPSSLSGFPIQYQQY